MRTRPSRSRGIPALLAAAIAVSLGQGCVPDNRPKVTIDPPKEPRPTRLVMTTTHPRDVDGNGYPDTLTTRVHLFEAEGGFPLAVTIPGWFKFDLISKGKTVASWTIDAEQTAARLVPDAVGPAYVFELSLLEGGRTDRLDTETIDLRCSFYAVADGTASPPPRASNVVSRHFGRTR